MFLNRKNSLLIILLLFCTFSLSSQNQVSDSLIKVFESQKKDTSALSTLHKICVSAITENNAEKSLEFAKKGIELAKKLDSKKQEMNFTYHAGKACIILSRYDDGKKYLLYGASDGKEFDKLYPQFLSALGTVYIKLGDYPKAMDYLLKSLKLKEEKKDSSGIVSTRSNMGNLYAKMKEPEQAMEEYRKCLAIAVHTNDWDLTNTYINFANGFELFGVMDSSDFYLLKARDLCIKNNNKKSLIVVYGNLGLNAMNKGLVKQAEDYFLKVIEVCEELGNREYIGTAYNSLSELSYKNNDYKKAITYAQKGLVISQELGIKVSELEARQLLYDSYKASSNYKEALEQHEVIVVLKDSLLGAEKQKEVTRKEMQFEFDKQQALQKAEQEKLDAIATEEKKKQRIILYAVSAGFLLLGLLAIVIYRNLRSNKEQNKIISIQKAIVEEKQKEILDSIHYAERIQKTLLANKEMINAHLPESFILFKPKDIVSGDFYWATQNTDSAGRNQFYLTVADSTGHGVPGAFMSLLNISFLNEAINEKNIFAPNQVFNHVRKRLTESMEGRQDGMDAVLLRITYAAEGMRIDYAAAHNAPLLISNGEMIHLKADKMPVGKGERNEDFILHTIEAKKGDLLYLYTDGYPDQFGGEKGKKFKYKQLEQFIESIHNLPLEEQGELLSKRFEEWKGELDQVDDVCIIGIRL